MFKCHCDRHNESRQVQFNLILSPSPHRVTGSSSPSPQSQHDINSIKAKASETNTSCLSEVSSLLAVLITLDMAETIPKPSEKRIAVVTGGNKGIGLEICRQLASNGIMVILTARDEKRGAEAVERIKRSGLPDVVFHQLDVTDHASIASLAEFIKTHFGNFDILVNNAGVSSITKINAEMITSKPEDEKVHGDMDDVPEWMKGNTIETYETAEECLRINYYGLKGVTEELIPLLQLSNSARIVNVSSVLGQLKVISNERVKEELSDINNLTEERLDQLLNQFLNDFKEGSLVANGWPNTAIAYKVSKVLVNSYTRILARRYPTLCINCVNPGFTKTDLNGNSGALTVGEGAEGPVKLALLPDGSPSGLFFNRTKLSTF